MAGNAWVTLATNDSYALGTLVLANSLRAVGTAHPIAVMVTKGVSSEMKERLEATFDHLFEVNVLDSQDEANLALLSRPELGLTFTKLHCWRLTQFQKCVFLDADTMVVQNCDELFDREELSAAPDAGWPDCFNSGVFVYRPSLDTFKALLAFAVSHGSFDGGDQGLLNSFFSDWAKKDIAYHLPFIYNMCSNAVYSYLPAYKKYGDAVKIVHFIGPNKPWLMHFDVETGCVHPPAGFYHVLPLLQKWWDIFFASVQSTLSATMAGLAGAFAQLRLGAPRSEAQKLLEEHLRRQNWEQGQADYMGADSFDNIWSKICSTINAVPAKSSRVKATNETTSASKTDTMKDSAPNAEATETQNHEALASETIAPISTTGVLLEKQSDFKASDEVLEVTQPIALSSLGTSISTVALPSQSAPLPAALQTSAYALVAPVSPPMPAPPASPPSHVPAPAPGSPIPAAPVSPPPLVSASATPLMPAPPTSSPHHVPAPAPASPIPAPPISPPPLVHAPASPIPAPPSSPPSEVPAAPASPPGTTVSPSPSPPVTTHPSTPITNLPSPPATAVLPSPPATARPVPAAAAPATATATASRANASVVVSASSASEQQESKVASPLPPSPGSGVDVTSGAKATVATPSGSDPAVPVPPKRRGPHKATAPKDTSKSAAAQPTKTSKPSPKGKK